VGKRVLIVGCGEIGSRHLQAVCALPEVAEIEIVDGRSDSLELGRARVAEVSDRQPHISFRWLPALDEASRSGDLCIVATRADVRCQVVAEIARRLSYRNFLIEKLVAQSVTDYEELIRVSQNRGLAVWVNCKKRVHGTHVHVKSRLNPEEPLLFSAIGGNHGLVTNGVHAADIFVFYDNASAIRPGVSRIDPVLHRTKRGLFDLSGTVCGYTDKGSSFTLSYAAEHMAPDVFSICSPRYRAIVDDTTKRVFESSAETEWNWEQVIVDANWNISYMTRSLASDVLTHAKCQLPTLMDCYPAHEFILTQVKPHFERLLGVGVEHCPAT
jgi:hypothetical protein